MQIAAAIKELEDKFSDEVPELVWATGAISYEYHFSSRDLFDALVQGSWHKNGTLFAADTTKFAIENGELMGLVIGMPGTEFKSRQSTLGPVWQRLVEKNQVNAQDIAGVVQRSEDASWLNPAIHANTYYIHAISVKTRFRGKRVGYHLMENAISTAREKGFHQLQLDVFSDNAAVDFYRAIGLEVLAETPAPKPSAFGVPPEYRMGMKL